MASKTYRIDADELYPRFAVMGADSASEGEPTIELTDEEKAEYDAACAAYAAWQRRFREAADGDEWSRGTRA